MATVPKGTIREKNGRTEVETPYGVVVFEPLGGMGDGVVWSGDRRCGEVYADERRGGLHFMALSGSDATVHGEYPTQLEAITHLVARTAPAAVVARVEAAARGRKRAA
jgi:hypothetical protein